MSSADYLREFVNERLTAAAEGISRAFKKGIADYEAETDRQRRQLDIVWLPEITLDKIELPQQHACKEEEDILADQQICNQERNSGLDQEDPEPQVKEEQEEVCISQEGEQLVLKEEIDNFMLTPAYEDNDNNEDQTVDLNPDETLSEPQRESAVNQLVISSVIGAPDSYLLLKSNDSRVAEIQDQKWEPRYKDLHVEPKFQLRKNTGKKTYMCKTCGVLFSRRSTLKVHMRTHTGEKPFMCKTCGGLFSRSYTLKVHMRTHTGEKPFMCKTCGGRFRESFILKVHMRTHTGEKPFMCKTCGERFRGSSSLKVHMRTHTGEKPFMCKTCGERFREGRTLKRHMRTHTGESVKGETHKDSQE